MSTSARFATTDYPVQVEDLLSERTSSDQLSVSAVAGYAVIATSQSHHALVFAIAAGSGLDALTIPIQQHTKEGRAPALSTWLAEKTYGTVNAIGIAILTSDGVLRIFRRVPVRSVRDTPPSCQEIRLSSMLAKNAPAVFVSRLVSGNLFVIGGNGSAAIVDIRERALRTRSVGTVTPARPASLQISRVFLSALKSMGAAAGADQHEELWRNVEGIHRIVGHGVIGNGIVIVREGGMVERWGSGGILWYFSATKKSSGNHSTGNSTEPPHVAGAGVTTEGTLAVVVEDDDDNCPRRLVCFDIRNEDTAPSEPVHTLPLGADQFGTHEKCYMLVSGDIIYVYTRENQKLAWVSVARGIPSDMQVQGSTPFESDQEILEVVDASLELPEASVTGGVAACMYAGGVWLASSAVPAPISLDDENGSGDGSRSIEDPTGILMRGFLQYEAGQPGATRASLKKLVTHLNVNGYGVREGISAVVQMISRKIVTSTNDPERDPLTLLVDTEIEKKQRQHRTFIRMLSDREIFAQVRPDAPSAVDDRLWDALRPSSKHHVLTDGEKLAAAAKIRALENNAPRHGYLPRFNDATMNTLMGDQHMRGSIRSTSVSHVREDDDTNMFQTSIGVLANALHQSGKEMRSTQGSISDDAVATGLYRYPYEFQLFLPHLQTSMAQALGQLDSDYNMIEEGGNAERGYRKALQTIVLLCCEAAISVVEGSLQARGEYARIFSRGRDAVEDLDRWVCDRTSCRGPMERIAQTALQIAKRRTQAEKPAILRAATLLVDSYLTCAELQMKYMKEINDSSDSRRHAHLSPTKRRKVDRKHNIIDVEYRREVTRALDMLREVGLLDEAFALAERHKDYGTMLSLRTDSDNFDEFMEKSFSKFGEEFAMYAFRWLENRDKLSLLIRGRPSTGVANDSGTIGGHSDRLSTLLSKYFDDDNRYTSHLAWMHFLAKGETDIAADHLNEQIQTLAKVGKKGSIPNVCMLSSISKLASLAHRMEIDPSADVSEGQVDYASAQYQLSRIQDRITSESENALLPIDQVVSTLVEQGSTDSNELAKNVATAAEAIQLSHQIGSEVETVENYLWRRCVERQRDTWMTIIESFGQFSDVVLREKLMDTALYKAACMAAVTESDISAVIKRGAFKESALGKQCAIENVTRLVQVTVSLAVSM